MPFTSGYKVNEGTDYEFTVSNETINEVVLDTGITEADIADYCYSALIDSRIETVKAESHTDVQQPGWASWCQDHAMFYYINNTRYINSNVGINNSSDTVYERNFLIWFGTIYPGEQEEKTGWFLIMDIKDIKRFYVNFSNAGFGQTTVASTRTDSGVTTPFAGYSGDAYTYNSSLANVYPDIYTDDDQLTTIRVINVLNINDELWVGRLNPSNYGEASTAYSTYGYAMYIDYKLTGWLSASDNEHLFQKGTINWAGIPKIIDMDYPDLGFDVSPVIRTYAESTDDMILDISAEHYGGFPVVTSAVPACKTLNGILRWMSWCGLLFKYDGVTYKPIIENGVIVGFSSNMFTPSEFDTMTNVTGNNISPVPPGPVPPGPGPYDDDPWHGVSFSGVGVGGAGAFAKCYYMTSTELANLRSWMNSNNVPEGFDPMAQIIGLSQVPVSLSGDDNTTVQFVNSSAVYDPGVTRVVDSGVSTQVSMGTPKRYSLGSVNITRRMQERGEPYLDYDCQVELYLPLIGMFSLDTQAVMGRTITAEAVLDPISGTLAAYAYVSRDGQNLPIAYGSTTIGVDLPITAQQYSVARAALKQANAQLGTSLLSSTLSLIAAATAGGKGSGTGAKTATGSTNGLAAAGIREAGADYMKASQAGNVFGDFMQWGRTIRQLSYGNNTAIAGSFGGSSAQWSYPFTPYVKIIRPRYEKPSNYNHSQGVPCVQTKKVGNCTGFIQCIGVDVSGITGATDIELQAIQAALTNGVFAGGGS